MQGPCDNRENIIDETSVKKCTITLVIVKCENPNNFQLTQVPQLCTDHALCCDNQGITTCMQYE